MRRRSSASGGLPKWPEPPPPNAQILDYGASVADTHLLDIELHTCLSHFWQVLWLDPRTVEAFLTAIGDIEIHVGPWETSEDTRFDVERRHDSRHRTGWIQFPGVPSTSLAFMHQQAQLPCAANGNVLTIVETVTMERLPYSNYFRVQLRWTCREIGVRPATVVRCNIEVTVLFHKKTWLAKVIMASVRKGCREGKELWRDVVVSRLEAHYNDAHSQDDTSADTCSTIDPSKSEHSSDKDVTLRSAKPNPPLLRLSTSARASVSSLKYERSPSSLGRSPGRSESASLSRGRRDDGSLIEKRESVSTGRSGRISSGSSTGAPQMRPASSKWAPSSKTSKAGSHRAFNTKARATQKASASTSKGTVPALDVRLVRTSSLPRSDQSPVSSSPPSRPESEGILNPSTNSGLGSRF